MGVEVEFLESLRRIERALENLNETFKEILEVLMELLGEEE